MAKKKKTIASKLKGLQKKWADAEPKRGGPAPEDGDYEGRITSAVLEE